MLFSEWKCRDVTLRNRIVVSPMCQYSSSDGFASDWHLVHLGSRAVGGAALVFTEACAVEARGRISPDDLGIWKDEHMALWQRIARYVRAQGAVTGIQLAHAGRKASTAAPWKGHGFLSPSAGGWSPVAPSPVPFNPTDPPPDELSLEGIADIVRSFAAAAKRALAAGFEVVELHAAHGYLLHEFLSPVSNRRTDGYGGSLEKRCRIVREVAGAVRNVWPERLPLFVRISATDWLEPEGWTVDQSVQLSRWLKEDGVDLIDCSSGALAPHAKIPAGPGFQVGFAERIRREAAIATGAVGFITEPVQAEEILTKGQADLVFLARAFLRDPYWPLHAAATLSAHAALPVQYERAF